VELFDGDRLGGRVHRQAGRRRVVVLLLGRGQPVRSGACSGRRPGTRARRQGGRSGRVPPDGPVHVLLLLMVMTAAAAAAVVVMVVVVVVGPRALGRRRWSRQRGRRPDGHGAAARTIGGDVGEFRGRRLCRPRAAAAKEIRRDGLHRRRRRRRLFQYRVRLLLVLVVRRQPYRHRPRLHHLQQLGGAWKLNGRVRG